MAASEPISLLFVDDDAAVLRAYEMYLEKDPEFTVTVCQSAGEALNILADRRFDAIISDIAMPGMDGLAFLREVRARDIPVIFVVMTGKRLAHIAIDAINAGADFYVQKSSDVIGDFKRMQDFLRVAVPKQRALQVLQGRGAAAPPPAAGSPVDLLCRFAPDGTVRYANARYQKFFGIAEDAVAGSSFFSLIPEAERGAVLSHIMTLSPGLPGKILEHHVLTRDGSQRLLQWHYQSIAGESGRTSGFQASGREAESIVRIGSARPAPAPAETKGRDEAPASPAKTTVVRPKSAPAPAAPATADATPNDCRMIEETVNGLDSPVFAIDRNGVVIAWNPAIEQLTGTDRKAVIGRAGFAHAQPFYGKPIPMLADYIFNPPDSAHPGTIEYKKMGDTYVGDTEHVVIQGKPMLLWGKVAAAYNATGAVIAAVEIITVAEPEAKGQAGETYLGGISSLTLKVSGEGAGASVAGAIGATTGGYGVYATSARVFVIRNPDLDVNNPSGVKFGTFIMSEFFGTMLDTSPRTIESLEKLQIFTAAKDELAAIELKRPVMLSGSVTFRTKAGGSFRVYIDHKKSYVPIEELMKAFAPEIVRTE